MQLKVLQVNSVDTVGGAARIAWTLHQAFLQKGHQSWMVVDRKYSEDQHVYTFPTLRPPSRHGQFFYWLAQKMENAPMQLGTLSAADILRRFAEPIRYWNRYWGKDDFDHRGTWQMLGLARRQPDIVHLHNLHSGYFDLRFLPTLSSAVPTICTLHDTWLLSGHCAYSLDCDRWLTGCGNCPYLDIYPAVKHDATSYNWNRKKEIYSRSRFYVATPSQWLLDQVNRSMLVGSIRRSRVIHNGVNLSTFYPANKQDVRALLNIPVDADVLLFVAGGVQNLFKDFKTIQESIQRIANESKERRVIFLALGGDGSTKHVGNVEIRSVPYINDPDQVANYYRAADVYMHAAHADAFPNVILEALACGTPVIATAVGGIPEQVVDGQTGFLTRPGDPDHMSTSVKRLLNDKVLHSKISSAAAQYAQKNFGLSRMVDDYLRFYEEILDNQKD